MKYLDELYTPRHSSFTLVVYHILCNRTAGRLGNGKGCNRKKDKKTQKWTYLSQKWSDFHSVKRILNLEMASITFKYNWGGSIRGNTVVVTLINSDIGKTFSYFR